MPRGPFILQRDPYGPSVNRGTRDEGEGGEEERRGDAGKRENQGVRAERSLG